MANDMLYLGTSGPEDPTRATLALAAAIGMKSRDKAVPVRVALLGQGTLLADVTIAGGIKVSGARSNYSTILEMIKTAQKLGIEFHC